MLRLISFISFVIKHYKIKQIKIIRVYYDNGEILEWNKD